VENGSTVRLDDWFLAAGERGNSHTAIDRRHGGVPWTEGNLAEVLIDGREYFNDLLTALHATGPGDSVYLTGLEGDADELLGGAGSEVAVVLAELSRRGVGVRGLVWRSHEAIIRNSSSCVTRAGPATMSHSWAAWISCTDATTTNATSAIRSPPRSTSPTMANGQGGMTCKSRFVAPLSTTSG
jgi:hypothetical protein